MFMMAHEMIMVFTQQYQHSGQGSRKLLIKPWMLFTEGHDPEGDRSHISLCWH
jgi:hypothetical protein